MVGRSCFTNMVEFQVSSKTFSCDVYLERRITILRGDSGTGKTSLVDCIAEFLAGSTAVEVASDMDFRVVDVVRDPQREWIGYSDTIILMDDSVYTEMQDFGNTVRDILIKNNLYLLIINRVDIPIGEELSVYSEGLDYSAKSIKVMMSKKEDPTKHYLVDFFRALKTADFDEIHGVDCIISEDKNGISQYIENFSSYPLLRAESKNNVCKTLRDADKEYGYKEIFIFADSASLGRNLNNLLYFSKFLSVYYDFDYECFEYMLLESNLLKDLWKFDSSEANSCGSWEEYYENTIVDITNKTYFRYTHKRNSRLKDCYLFNCDDVCIEGKKSKCSGYRKCSNKVKYLFEGTDFSYILNLLDKLED